jgi:hypothetical protein
MFATPCSHGLPFYSMQLGVALCPAKVSFCSQAVSQFTGIPRLCGKVDLNRTTVIPSDSLSPLCMFALHFFENFMFDLQKIASKFSSIALINCGGFFDIDAKQREVDDREHRSQAPGFWDDNQAAQKVMQEIAERKEWIFVWSALKTQCDDIAALVELCEESAASFRRKRD